MKGNVFHIQKFSIHDGPGIRTTVFLKGCPLHCAWCANPESQSDRTQVLYDRRRCTGCLQCVSSCVHGALSIRDGYPVRSPSACTGCLACVSACPAGVLTSSGEVRDLTELVQICLQDVPFYEESGGGVTLSGGECMMQPDFVRAFGAEMHRHGIHLAAETTGSVSPAVFQQLAPEFDLLLYDLKHWNEKAHRHWTGVSLDPILANLRWALEAGIPVLVRIPVIPGVNDTLPDAAAFSRLLRALGISQVQLLPFHQMGEGKYGFLERDYAFGGLPSLHPEDLQDYKDVFEVSGIAAFF